MINTIIPNSQVCWFPLFPNKSQLHMANFRAVKKKKQKTWACIKETKISM